MEKKQEFFKSAGTPKQQDRATVVITGHYQEYDPNTTTHCRIAYDRVLAPECVPHQTTLRVNPGKRVQIPMGEVEPGKAEFLLAHDVPKVQGDNPSRDILLKAQAANIIKISNADGVLLGTIAPNRGCAMHFAGEVWAESTHATSLLKVTVFPA